MNALFENSHIIIHGEQLGPWGTNTYTVTCKSTLASALIDAPGDPGKIMGMLSGTVPRYILLTHNHPDHIGALAEMKSRLQVPLATHVSDTPGLMVQPDILLEDGDRLELGDIIIDVIHTPGHTPGSLCFHIGDYLLGGDTVFPGGPGKTWLPDDFNLIIKSITGRIYALPDDTLILPGHGESITVKASRTEHDAFAARPHDDDLYGDVLWASA